jgi:hypothetical protein
MIEILLWVVGVYLVIGAVVAWILSETPYSGNGWLIIILLWPVFVWAFLS